MSKAGFLARYGTIYHFLERNPYASYEQLIDVLTTRSETLKDRHHKANMGISQRTLQRDFVDMRTIFGINIEYDRMEKGLIIRANAHALLNNFHQLVEASALTSALVEGIRYAPYLKLSGKPNHGLQNLPQYLEAIEKRQCLQIEYAPFDGKRFQRTVAPYQIREYDGRWYLIARDTNPESGYIKCFALDRIESHILLDATFERPDMNALDTLFAPCMGITKSDVAIQEVVLLFSREEAPYIKTLPLHPSQQILEESNKGLRIQISVYDTWELRAKIRSYGTHVKVLAPESLRAHIAEDLRETLKKYRKTDLPVSLPR